MASFKHGETGIPLYNIWHHMKQRCHNVKNHNYKDYGGRGIVVCRDWFNSYLTFKEWAMNNGYKEGLTIDRIDVNGNYKPSTCRWATRKQQARNRRSTRLATYKGDTRPITEWCEILNLNYWTVVSRLDRLGWSVEKALGGDIHE